MLLRFVLLLVLIVFIARAFWRVVDGMIAGVTGQPRTRVPQSGVKMVRDPVCGTFLLPERAITLSDGRRQLFFCSTTCRDTYRARTA